MIGIGIPINHNRIPRMVLVSPFRVSTAGQRWALGKVPKSAELAVLADPGMGRSHRRLAPTNLPRRGFLLEITELPNVEVFGAVLLPGFF